jgi:putative hydrolase of the HAD superfamily
VLYDFVWFDLGYTLLHTKREKQFRAVLAHFDIDRSEEDIGRAFHMVDKLFMREYPGVLGKPAESFMPWYMGFVCHNLAIEGDILRICVRWMDAWTSVSPLWHAYDVAAPTLSQLSEMGVGVGVISNWDASAKPILKECGLLDYFDPCVISSEVGVSKPSEWIFRLALDRAGVDPSRCLYVGDNYYDDTVGAATVGMDSVIVNRFGGYGIEELSGQTIVPDVSAIVPIVLGDHL